MTIDPNDIGEGGDESPYNPGDALPVDPGYNPNARGYEDLNVVDGRTSSKTYYRVGKIGKMRLTVGRPFWAVGTEHVRGPKLKHDGKSVGTLAVKVHVEFDEAGMKDAELSKRCPLMGTSGKIRRNKSYMTGFIKVQVAYMDDPYKDHARFAKWRDSLNVLAAFVIKHAQIEGAEIVADAEHIASFIAHQMKTSHNCAPAQPEGRKKAFEELTMYAWYSNTTGAETDEDEHPLNGTDSEVGVDGLPVNDQPTEFDAPLAQGEPGVEDDDDDDDTEYDEDDDSPFGN